MNTLLLSHDAQGPWQGFTSKEGIFSDIIPRKFDQLCSIWIALKTVIMQTLWLERNDVVINNEKWSPNKVLHRIWLGLVDYEHLEWKRRQTRIFKTPRSARHIEQIFANKWCRQEIITTSGEVSLEGILSFSPRWILLGPRRDFVFEFN